MLKEIIWLFMFVYDVGQRAVVPYILYTFSSLSIYSKQYNKTY